MAQRYTSVFHDLCPECGTSAEAHVDDPRFWMPRRCDLVPTGVVERIEQYKSDLESERR